MIYCYGQDDQGSRVRLPAGAGNFSLHRRVQNGSGAHPASYPVGTTCSFSGVKRLEREADHSTPSSDEVKEWMELYLHSPNTPSWSGAQSKHKDNFTFTLLLCNNIQLHINLHSTVCFVCHVSASTLLLLTPWGLWINVIGTSISGNSTSYFTKLIQD
jgi:hypothetical protein